MTHIEDFLHVIPSKLLTPDETLNTSDRNQKKFTIFSKPEGLSEIDIWRVVAVTLEKNVAIVVMFKYPVVALSFSSARNCGRAIIQFCNLLSQQHNKEAYLFLQNHVVLLQP